MADLPIVLYWGEIISPILFEVFGVLLICTVFMCVCVYESESVYACVSVCKHECVCIYPAAGLHMHL